MLTKDQIKAAKDRPRVFVPIVEWTPDGETFDPTRHGVYVGTMTAREKDAWDLEIYGDENRESAVKENIRAKLAVRTVQNEDGSLMFTPDDIAWLGEKASGPLAKIFDAASPVNKLENKHYEETVKGF